MFCQNYRCIVTTWQHETCQKVLHTQSMPFHQLSTCTTHWWPVFTHSTIEGAWSKTELITRCNYNVGCHDLCQWSYFLNVFRRFTIEDHTLLDIVDDPGLGSNLRWDLWVSKDGMIYENRVGGKLRRLFVVIPHHLLELKNFCLLGFSRNATNFLRLRSLRWYLRIVSFQTEFFTLLKGFNYLA